MGSFWWRNTAAVVAMLAIVLLIVGCETSGELKPVPGPASYVGPTISNFTSTARTLSKVNGGILDISCRWNSPNPVATAAAFLAFVRSLQDPKTEPVGIIGSGTATTSLRLPNLAEDFPSRQIFAAPLAQTASEAALASEAAFFAKFADPIVIPSGIGTNDLTGLWRVQLPFPAPDLVNAPLGNQQMLLWMNINGMRTNSLAFEITINP
jgi:hypothetical protein